MKGQVETYWTIVWKQFKQHRLGYFSFLFVGFLALIALYAPFLASSQPIVVRWRGEWYFPLFRYLFYTGFYTKRIDLFYNILMFSLPLGLIAWQFPKIRRPAITALISLHVVLFVFYGWFHTQDPAADRELNQARHRELMQQRSQGGDPLLRPLDLVPSWDFDLQYKNDYAQLEMVLRYLRRREQHERLQQYSPAFAEAALNRWLITAVIKKRQEILSGDAVPKEMPSSKELRKMVVEGLSEEQKREITEVPTLWKVERENRAEERQRNLAVMENIQSEYPTAKTALTPIIEACNNQQPGFGGAAIEEEFQQLATHCDTTQLTPGARARLTQYRRIIEEYEAAAEEEEYESQKQKWLEVETERISFLLMPLLRNFHWEDDAGGEQNLNRFLPWHERTRTNRKDLVAGLLFGIRISLVVGVLAVGLALIIGIPIGAVAGYYGGKFDIAVSRILEVWESMPTFFMLLLVVAITQSKSIFLVIGVIGLFGWTGFSRYMRGEVLKQRNLAYVEASHALGLTDQRIIFSHILPNAIPPILTLLPFAIMGAITSEAGLSFLGLGEEGSCSWGVLMDEGRQAFPGESYLLWPPAIMLTLLLVAIALVGDALRDSLDPKLRQN